jgi:hypothetical protein
VFAVKKYRPYLEDKPFLFPQEFNFRVEHCPGNELPDVLSRQPEDAEVPDDAIAIDVPTLLDEVKAAQLADSDFPGVLERWRRIREEGPREPGERSFPAVYDVVDGHLVKWVIKMKRDKWTPTDHSCLCEVLCTNCLWGVTNVINSVCGF